MKYGFLENISDVNFSLPEAPTFQSKYFEETSSNSTKFYIGSSVWADKDFKGHFFPANTPQKNFLQAYANQFNAVEVNATRYGVPRASTLKTWKENVPPHFRFSFKMPQIISQRKNLLQSEVLQKLDDFVLGMEYMGEKAGTTFILLQNNFSAERLNELDKFLSYLPTSQSFAVECRNPELNSTEAFNDMLHQHNVANVITDTAGRRDVVHQIVTGQKAFVRFVGNGLVPTDYDRILDWVKIFKKWTTQGVKEIVCLHHQPNENRRFAGYSANYMIEEILKTIPNTNNLKKPTLYSNSELF